MAGYSLVGVFPIMMHHLSLLKGLNQFRVIKQHPQCLSPFIGAPFPLPDRIVGRTRKRFG